MAEHSKYYWEDGRNGWYHTTTLDDFSEKEVVSEIDNHENNERVPEYYKGKNGYMARKVIDNFDLSYNIGTAVTYLLRAYRKHETPDECIRKAIDHLNFELEKIDE
jgi:hypothetical protein